MLQAFAATKQINIFSVYSLTPPFPPFSFYSEAEFVSHYGGLAEWDQAAAHAELEAAGSDSGLSSSSSSGSGEDDSELPPSFDADLTPRSSELTAANAPPPPPPTADGPLHGWRGAAPPPPPGTPPSGGEEPAPPSVAEPFPPSPTQDAFETARASLDTPREGANA